MTITDCPFCGHTRCKVSRKGVSFQVWCARCKARGPLILADWNDRAKMQAAIDAAIDRAVECWNTRSYKPK